MHLAQYNVVRMAHPFDSDELAGFRELLDPIHQAGDESPGFVWRFKGEGEKDATKVRPPDGDPDILVAMTVWETPQALKAFLRGPHFAAFVRRREWFEKNSGQNVCWWVEVGHRPTVEEGHERLEYWRAHGSTPYAFTLRDVLNA